MRLGSIVVTVAACLVGTSISLAADAHHRKHPVRHPRINPALGVWEAPIGHRQPNARTVPARVRRAEGSRGSERVLDSALRICHGC